MLSEKIPFELAGFQPWRAYGSFAFHSISSASAETQFQAFADRVVSAIGRKYLPIYRMADGEFSLLLGYRRSRAPGRPLKARVKGALLEIAGRLRVRRFGTMWGEQFSRMEITKARRRLAELIPWLAEHGILAAYFMARGDGWGDEFVRPMMRWLAKHDVVLREENYIPFYFVYALLNGPRRKQVFGGRHVLIATFVDDARREAITQGLTAVGAAKVSFLPISKSRAMFDTIDCSNVGNPDIALVAGGIGAINIIKQLEPLNIPAIDCGITIECFIDAKRKQERPFLDGDVD